jgi:thioredoxin reductase (NADPH)
VPKPLIIAVDDDRAVLNAIDRDLRQKYGREYRVLKAESGAVALTALQQLHERDEVVGLIVSDQRMPEMTGVQFLLEARKLYPDAKRVLLTAYADTEAAITSINLVGLDYYLMKPWDPPSENLYPILDDLLDDWKASARLPYEGIRVIGALWSPDSHEVKDFLARHQIAYQWLDIDRDPKARELVEQHGQGLLQLPVILFPEGDVLVKPAIRALAERTGFQTHATQPFYDIVIIGAGPAGLAAAVYGSSEGSRCLVIERAAPGGQAGNSPKIENYLGFPAGISGMDLARRATTQALRFGAEIISTLEAMSIRVQDPYRVVTLSDGSEVTGKSVLIATGAQFNRLEAPGVAELTGAGVYYGAAYTEAINFAGQNVFVVGGANSAGQGALFLSRFASKVTMLIRGPVQHSSRYLVDALGQNEKIERLFNTDLVEVRGEPGQLAEIRVKNSVTGEIQSLAGAAMFVFIGARPQSDLVADLVRRNPAGFLITGSDLLVDGKRPEGWQPDRDPFLLETSVPGIFAAGDVRQGTNNRVASATGEGGIAIAAIQQYLKTI